MALVRAGRGGGVEGVGEEAASWPSSWLGPVAGAGVEVVSSNVRWRRGQTLPSLLERAQTLATMLNQAFNQAGESMDVDAAVAAVVAVIATEDADEAEGNDEEEEDEGGGSASEGDEDEDRKVKVDEDPEEGGGGLDAVLPALGRFAPP